MRRELERTRRGRPRPKEEALLSAKPCDGRYRADGTGSSRIIVSMAPEVASDESPSNLGRRQLSYSSSRRRRQTGSAEDGNPASVAASNTSEMAPTRLGRTTSILVRIESVAVADQTRTSCARRCFLSIPKLIERPRRGGQLSEVLEAATDAGVANFLLNRFCRRLRRRGVRQLPANRGSIGLSSLATSGAIDTIIRDEPVSVGPVPGRRTASR